MADLSVPIDWMPGVVERWSWKTDILLSWNGGEQRRVVRAAPVVEFEADALLAGSEASAWLAWLDTYQASEFAMPYWPAGDGAAATLTARFLEPVEQRWLSPAVIRAALKARLIAPLPAPTASVPTDGGLDILGVAPDFKRSPSDAWRRLLDVLDYETGPLRVIDRSGFARRRWGAEYLLAGDTEIQVARSFFWRRAGQAKPARFAAPEGGYVKARADGDIVEWHWITPALCRVSVGILTLPPAEA